MIYVADYVIVLEFGAVFFLLRGQSKLGEQTNLPFFDISGVQALSVCPGNFYIDFNEKNWFRRRYYYCNVY